MGAGNFPISGEVSDYTFWMAVSVEGAETDPENDFWSLFRPLSSSDFSSTKATSVDFWAAKR